MRSKETVVKGNQEFFRAKEAAVFLRVSEATVWRWSQIGKIAKGIKIGEKVTVWRRDDLMELLN